MTVLATLPLRYLEDAVADVASHAALAADAAAAAAARYAAPRP